MTTLSDRRHDMITILGEFSSLMKQKGDMIRSRSYQKAQESLMKHNEPITKVDQLKKVSNIGEAIYKKMDEYLKTGKIDSLERLRNDPRLVFTNIYGVGAKKAQELVDKGVSTIKELREQQEELLNNNQKIGLKYYEDILEKIPRKEIDEYNCLFSNAFNSVKQTTTDQFEIVGSYRRGLKQSGDIDVIITSQDRSLFPKFIEQLQQKGIITEILSQGLTKCLVVAHLTKKSKARRVDFMYTSPEEYPFAILYFTGSKAFNTVMRAHALTLGYTMNEHGITTKSKEKINHTFLSEQDVFNFLGLVYKAPEHRIDGNSIEFSSVPKQTSPSSKHKLGSPKNKTIKKKNQEPKNEIVTKEPKRKLITTILKEFQKDGITVIESLTEKQLESAIDKANVLYRSKKPLLTDSEYDILMEYMARNYPDNPILNKIGAPVIEKNKVTLPYFMGSMDKIKPDSNALGNWNKKYKGPYILSCKLDGVSGLYTTNGETPKLYTRGDGKVGQDVSHFISHLKLPKVNNMVVRGEFILSRKTFETKYTSQFANARNLVSGIINSKRIDPKLKDLDFVAYEVIVPDVKPSEQMKLLEKSGFTTVQHRMEKALSNELLSSVLVDWRTHYDYEIDGVIVTNDKVYPRKDKNPEHSFAFKMVLSEQMAEAKVVDVIWTTSKAGYIKPKIRIEPIQLGGVKIEYATGFNGQFIESNKIGVGAVVEIIRSGDVIPYIKNVITPASQTKMPNIPYVWNDTHVDVLVTNIEQDEDVLAKRVHAFFTGLEVDGLSSGNLKRMKDTGFSTIADILAMKESDFMKVDGFKEKTSKKIHTSIQEQVKKASLIDIMAVSNTMGRGLGKRKLEPMMNAYPDILVSKETNQVKYEQLQTINGIGKENARSFVDNIENFKTFLKETKLTHKLTIQPPQNIITKPKDTSHVFYEKKVVMTKVRDKEIIQALETHGGELINTVNKHTWVLIVKSKDDISSKTKKAQELNIPVMTPDEFREKYMKN